jgi:hypothetical protein
MSYPEENDTVSENKAEEDTLATQKRKIAEEEKAAGSKKPKPEGNFHTKENDLNLVNFYYCIIVFRIQFIRF